MSLLSIRADIISRIGITGQGDEKIFVDKQINDAAEEIYVANDLIGCLREQIIRFDRTDKQIALPYNIFAIRGLRFYNSKYSITLNDMRPRYNIQSWSISALNYREKGQSPLKVQLSNFSILQFELPLAETFDVTINIVGSTPNSSKIQEVVVIPAGTLVANSVNNFIDIESLNKTLLNNYDIIVKDAADTEIAVIPNSELFSSYKIVQVLDDSIENTIENSGVEILYKTRFTPFQNDFDEFPCQGYDKAITWKFMEHYFGQQKDGLNAALAAGAKCNSVLAQIALNNDVGKKLEMDFLPNHFYGLFRPIRWNAMKTW